jgi:hypothetical protein
MTSTKPTVHFNGEAMFMQAYDSSYYASVFALDHPKLGRGWVRTSRIVSKSGDGSFETMNTIYVPAKDKSEAV